MLMLRGTLGIAAPGGDISISTTTEWTEAEAALSRSRMVAASSARAGNAALSNATTAKDVQILVFIERPSPFAQAEPTTRNRGF
jgi:hypothetical protein